MVPKSVYWLTREYLDDDDDKPPSQTEGTSELNTGSESLDRKQSLIEE